FSRYVRGQLTECVILGSLCYIGMTIIGLEYALLISTILTISALIPLMGAYIGAFLGAMLLLMVQPLDAVWFLIFIVCLQQFEGNVIYPKVVGSSMGLPGIWTLTAVMVFGSLFGIPGIIIGTPSAAVVYTLIKHNTEHRLSQKEISPAILDGAEVRILYQDVLEPERPEEEEEERGQNLFHTLWLKISGMFHKITKH
ncbi:MAG: AI-2E family transporter, partial [Oscillospiraceae bacterium]